MAPHRADKTFPILSKTESSIWATEMIRMLGVTRSSRSVAIHAGKYLCRGSQRLTHAHLATGQVFVGGISWQFKDADLKEAFSRYDPADAQCILDKATARPRGFGFVWFKNKLGMEDACRDMHNKVI